MQPDERLRLLRRLARRLHPPARRSTSAGQARSGRRQIFLALHDTIERFELPVQLFDDLLSAFGQDVTTTRYATWADVLDYCRRSANPVGRLVLRLSGYRDDRARRGVRRGLHGAAADQLLAGPGDRLVARPAVRARRDLAARTAPTPRRSIASAMTPAWRRRCATAAAGRARCSSAGRPVCDGVIGTAALRAARDVARRHADPRSARARPASTCSPPGRSSEPPTH